MVYHSDSISQILDWIVLNFGSIYQELSVWYFGDPEKSVHNGRFSSSCSANDSHLFSSFYLQIYLLKNIRQILTIPGKGFPELYLSLLNDIFKTLLFRWPVQTILSVSRFRLNVHKRINPFKRCDFWLKHCHRVGKINDVAA